MNSITTREFQIHTSSALRSIPLVVTKYGKPCAIVLPHSSKLAGESEKIEPKPKAKKYLVTVKEL